MVTLSSLAMSQEITGGSCASPSSSLDRTHLLLLQHGHRLVIGLDQVARVHLGFEVQPLQCMVKELVQNSCAGLHSSTWSPGIRLTPGRQIQTCCISNVGTWLYSAAVTPLDAFQVLHGGQAC